MLALVLALALLPRPAFASDAQQVLIDEVEVWGTPFNIALPHSESIDALPEYGVECRSDPGVKAFLRVLRPDKVSPRQAHRVRKLLELEPDQEAVAYLFIMDKPPGPVSGHCTLMQHGGALYRLGFELSPAESPVESSALGPRIENVLTVFEQEAPPLD